MLSLLALAATCWGVLMSLAPLLQVRVILREKSATGVSPAWLAVLVVGFALWLAYGVALGDLPLVLTNLCSISVGTFTLLVVLRYRRGTPRQP